MHIIFIYVNMIGTMISNVPLEHKSTNALSSHVIYVLHYEEKKSSTLHPLILQRFRLVMDAQNGSLVPESIPSRLEFTTRYPLILQRFRLVMGT